MSAGKIFLAALLGGIALFIWGAVSHMALGLGDSNFKGIPNEEAVLSAMKTNLTEPGLYFFPWMDMKNSSPEAMKAWEEKYMAGPNGLLVYHPTGEKPLAPKQLIIQFLTDFLAVLFATILLAKAASNISGYFGRVIFVATFGLISTLALSFPYWNWYGFPFGHTLAELIEQVVGFFIAGLVLAAFIKASSKSVTA
ncbi:hypothetical protein A2W24_01910 [Microgenomates group bacterium RBG_16_45_19]|nr:MAG: hypothetical protein A2W24_01910 [Microgenomates group bacterium RBG_16_45_19]